LKHWVARGRPRGGDRSCDRDVIERPPLGFPGAPRAGDAIRAKITTTAAGTKVFLIPIPSLPFRWSNVGM
jgi:hypothetical protein